MNSRQQIPLILLCSIMVCGCADGGAGGVTVGSSLDEPAVTRFQMQLTDQTRGTTAAPVWMPAALQARNFRVTQAEANLRRVGFHTSDVIDCDRYDESSQLPGNQATDSGDCDPQGNGTILSFPGPFRVNLLTGASTPSMDSLALPTATYSDVEIRIDVLESEPPRPDDPLNGNGIVLFGQYADGGDIPIRIDLEIDQDLIVRSASGFNLAGATGNLVRVQFSADRWFTGLDGYLDECLADPETNLDSGQLIVSETDPAGNECDGLVEHLETTLEDAGELESSLEEDDDDDPEDRDQESPDDLDER